MALCQWLQKLTHAVMFFSPAKVSVDDRPLKEVYVNQIHFQIILLSQPRLTSCQLLSMMSIVFVWYIQERDSWGSSSTLLSMSQHLSIPRTGNTQSDEYRNITIRVAWLNAGSCIFLPQLMSYHGKGQASLRCEWNWCPSNPSHAGFNFSGAESFWASFKLLKLKMGR